MPRLLIITNKFYPDSSVAAVRMTEWARELPAHGWDALVMCRNFGYPSKAAEYAAAVHPRVRLEYLNTWSTSLPRRLARRVSFMRFAAPDLQVVFWRRAAARIAAAARAFGADVVLTSSPPHAIHAAGRDVSATLDVPWIADFRDPYLFDPRFRPHGADKLLAPWHERFERSIYDRAAAVLHAIPGHARWARARYPEAADRIVYVPNGAPATLLALPLAARARESRRSVRIVGFCGAEESIVIAHAIQSLVVSGQDLDLRIVGTVPEFANAIRSILGDRAQFTGPLSHPDALREIGGADVLVATLSRERASYQLLTSKIFEYLAAGRPTIVVNPSMPDVEVFSGAPGLEMLRAPDEEEMHRALQRALATPDSVLSAQRDFVASTFRRDAQVATIAAILDRLTGRGSSTSGMVSIAGVPATTTSHVR